jgi:hypothetical protein
MKTAEKGFITLLGAVMISIVFLTIITGLILVSLSGKLIGKQLLYQGQANNTAQAGLTEALSWFRKQDTQPVAAFAPQRDEDANPPILETEDSSIGLVRSYEVSELGNVWGRYEVRMDSVQDVTNVRGKTGVGTIWQIESNGLIYVQNDADQPYNVLPNRVLVNRRVRAEIQRMTVVLPGGNAAIQSLRADNITIGNKAKVLGGSGIGLVYPPSTGSPTIQGSVTGSPATSSISPFPYSIQEIFGVSDQELSGMADIVVTDMDDLPQDLPGMSIIVIQGDAVFTQNRPLMGSGILIVYGDLELAVSSNSNYSGIIYVTGDYEQNAPSLVSGAIIALNGVAINGLGDFAEVDFDDAILTNVQQQMSQYRFSRNPYMLDKQP